MGWPTTDEEIVREGLLHGAPYAASDDHTALDALDRLVADRDRMERDVGALSTRVEELLARAEAAE